MIKSLFKFKLNMLRERIRKLILNKKSHPTFKRLARLLILIGILWILSFPYLARKVFTSENALNAEFLSSFFESDSTSYSTFKTL